MKKILLSTVVLGTMAFASMGNMDSVKEIRDHSNMKEKFQNMSEDEKKAFMEFIKENKRNKEGKSLEDIKTRILESLTKRISELEEAKTCIKSANSKEDLKACKPEKPDHKEMKKGREGFENGNRENWQKRGNLESER